ncbi:prenyltransferase/squalene oxidase repeat-containing protein [Kitasatospora indigofera]|uniref:prenyltransferase/squalene oxidase repeat-containing protein n=1 Tax=Kitasatospora indigofera TaxID=67307 RepID=UPI0036A86670
MATTTSASTPAATSATVPAATSATVPGAGGAAPRPDGRAHLTTDGGARQGGADLWCTYAAVRTLDWLGGAPARPAATAESLLSRQNRDGGFAWQKGLPSDVWATYYSTQALLDLGRGIPHREALLAWVTGIQHRSGGFAMTAGQEPDVWATYYATRVLSEVLRAAVPRAEALAEWLTAIQRADGGLGWYPGAGESDVRACYYGATAWRAAFGSRAPGWRTGALVGWLNARQTAAGGFVFDEGSTATCLWATFRAVRALDALGARPAREQDCLAWIDGRQGPGAAFTRWEGYPDADVWASFSAVGALQTLGREPRDRAAVLEFLGRCELPEGGFSYREGAAAGDSLATAALLLTGAAGRSDAVPDDRRRDDEHRDEERPDGRRPDDRRPPGPGPGADGLARWLRAAHLPYEGGVMYMPGRGAEIRCTLWAVSALAFAGLPGLDAGRLTGWLRRLQNSDGGFGYWHGRASDMVSTVSALEILHQLGRPPEVLDTDALRAFLDSCAADGGEGDGNEGGSGTEGDGTAGHRYTPGSPVTCAATAQAARALHLLGDPVAALAAAGRLQRYASRIGGYASAPRGVPDLASTYQAVRTRQVLGLPVDGAELRRFTAKLRGPAGHYSWSPLTREAAGPLADALGTLLDRAERLPPLNL